jgi:hypothetical protein
MIAQHQVSGGDVVSSREAERSIDVARRVEDGAGAVKGLIGLVVGPTGAIFVIDMGCCGIPAGPILVA